MIYLIDTRPGELAHSNGKIHHFSWENPRFRLGHFQLLFVCSPEGKLVGGLNRSEK